MSTEATPAPEPSTEDASAISTRRQALQLLAAWSSTWALAGCGGDGASPPPAAQAIEPGQSSGPAALPALPAVEHSSPPEPAKPPPPRAVPTGEIGVIQSRPLGTAQLYFRDYFSGGRYVRYIRNSIVGASVGIIDFVSEGSVRGFKSAGYTLLCDGQPVARATPALGALMGSFEDVDLSAIEDGWRIFDIAPDDGPEAAAPYWMFVAKGDSIPDQKWAPTQNGSYALYGFARWGKVPATLAPGLGWPLPERKAVHFADTPPAASMFRRMLAPCINGDPPYLHTLERGIRTTLNTHGYAWSTMTTSRPGVVLRDGPRGVGTLAYATHLQVGRRGGVYFCDPWRVGHIDSTGHLKTLAGFRHGESGIELVGDWSAVPAERRGFHELWGMAWDLRTVAESALDKSVLLDRGDGSMENPHTKGPVAFVADSQNNRVCKLEFHPRDHAAAPKVSEFVLGAQDAWDVVYHDGLIYVSERTAHRIAAYDATTGQYVRTLVSGQALATVGKSRVVSRTAALEAIRQQPCVAPEGLFYQDGWLYYGSFAMSQVKRIRLATGEIEVFASYDLWSKSNFIKIALSDGSFGPRGTVFGATWGVLPTSTPDGKPWINHVAGSTAVKEGRGGNYADSGYAMSVGIGDGRMITSGADYGIGELSLSQDSDPPRIDKDLYERGYGEYESAGHRLIHGVDGFGQFGYELPWGKSQAMDYYLRALGHVRE